MDPILQILDPADAGAAQSRLKSLSGRSSPLASPSEQLRVLAEAAPEVFFEEALKDAQVTQQFTPVSTEFFQINLGKLCNMTCRHCHVDSGPDRITENMDRATVDACLDVLDQTDAHTVDLTGGAPELNPHFRYLVDQCHQRGKHVIDRCNLTVLLLPRNKDLIEFLGSRDVEIVCSLPHYRARNTDAQRGDGTYEKSLEALRRLNAAGYGQGDPKKRLTLVSNPAGAFLAGDQTALEAEWKAALARNHNISFDRLFCLNNMPIARFLEWLIKKGDVERYLERLTSAFNPGAVSGLMCRNTISVSWDGRLFDCDFNQMLNLDISFQTGEEMTVHNFSLQEMSERRIRTDRHCFGCTAGSGSSCGGATA